MTAVLECVSVGLKRSSIESFVFLACVDELNAELHLVRLLPKHRVIKRQRMGIDRKKETL